MFLLLKLKLYSVFSSNQPPRNNRLDYANSMLDDGSVLTHVEKNDQSKRGVFFARQHYNRSHYYKNI